MFASSLTCNRIPDYKELVLPKCNNHLGIVTCSESRNVVVTIQGETTR